MTTKVTVDAHAGWPVHVTRVSLEGSEQDTVTVQPNEVQDFYVHSGVVLHIREGEKDPE